LINRVVTCRAGEFGLMSPDVGQYLPA
jgi:hypothetical protein